MLQLGQVKEMRVARNLCENLFASDVLTRNFALKKKYETALLRMSDAHVKKAHLTSSNKEGINDW